MWSARLYHPTRITRCSVQVTSHVKLRMVLITMGLESILVPYDVVGAFKLVRIFCSVLFYGADNEHVRTRCDVNKGSTSAVWEIEVEAEVEGEQPVGPRCRPSRVHQRATHTVVAHEKAVFSTTQCVVCMIGLLLRRLLSQKKNNRVRAWQPQTRCKCRHHIFRGVWRRIHPHPPCCVEEAAHVKLISGRNVFCVKWYVRSWTCVVVTS